LEKTKTDLEQNQKTISGLANVIRDRIRYKRLQYDVVQREEAKKEEVKNAQQLAKRGISLEPILARVNKLPEFLVAIIREYFPYSTRVNLIESRIPTSKLLHRLNHSALDLFMRMITVNRTFLSLLTAKEAFTQIKYVNGRDGRMQNPMYKPFCSEDKEPVSVLCNKFAHLIHLAKEKNPRFAYKILSIVHILIDPTKKYKMSNRGWSYFPPLLEVSNLPAKRRTLLSCCYPHLFVEST
jgi:hypothetical protein